MPNRENLDLSENREIKTYAEMSDMEMVEFREKKERELEDLIESLKKHGVSIRDVKIEGSEGVEIKIEEKEGKEGKELRLIIEQKSGEGIRGLGYDGKIWMRLNQEKANRNVANKFRHDENTKASLKSDFSGVIFEEVGEGKIKVQIDPDHPAIAMAKFLGNKEVQLRGSYNNWGDENPFKYIEKSEKWECELEWEEEEECKIMIRDIEYKESKKVTRPIKAEWNKEFAKGARQMMEIVLEPEQGLDE
ncbi:hypothetical protein KAS31_00495 [Candidatus Parcubacteria bacterium]|nr:hypothetical protein [Candidatus Parcubacteria bacterium]